VLHGTDGYRMSKSRGNVVTPDEMVESFGADALRLYSMFIAPFDQEVNWNTEGINGTRRFLNKIWRLFSDTYEQSQDAQGKDPKLESRLHKLIRDITNRIEEMQFNTMVSDLMGFVNVLGELHRSKRYQSQTYHQTLETLILLIAPSAPHIAEELWHQTGHTGSVHHQRWPEWDPDLVVDEMVSVAVQVNGKMRIVLQVPADADKDEVEAVAIEQPQVLKYTDGKKVSQVIYVPGKVLNIVVK
jgi:leucyl-tRNA synthetase